MKALYTVGYTGTKPLALLAKVVEYDAILVDTRFMPFSRAPQWTKHGFRKLFGARYVHVKEFGNRNYKGGPIDILNLPRGIEIVKDILTENAIVLMCGCSHVENCHRRVVAEAIHYEFAPVGLGAPVHWTHGDVMDGYVDPGGKVPRGSAAEKRAIGLPKIEQLGFFNETTVKTYRDDS